MEARTRALEQQHEQERLAERPQELAQRLAGLAARRSDLAASLGAARAANERARAEAAAAAAAANKEAEEVEEARAQGQEQVFEAGRQQKVNGTKWVLGGRGTPGDGDGVQHSVALSWFPNCEGAEARVRECVVLAGARPIALAAACTQRCEGRRAFACELHT